jgi:phosphoribosyl 1,2-cyclic phosphodiesterase
MNLKVLGSGSSGNCYILESPAEALMIEAGLPFMEVKKALGFNVRKIVGVVVSHCHGDHAGYIRQYEAGGIPVCKAYGKYTEQPDMRFGRFKIYTFDLTDAEGHFKHNNSDGSECPCYGFFITHPDMGNLVYATDTELIKWKFGEAKNILVEANYSIDLIDPTAVNRNHVLTGHMELQTTLDFLRVNNNPELRNVVLCHLSSSNADPIMFREAAKKVVSCPVEVAEKGLVLSLDLVPF